jgi:CheY-like chemotaxis protein
VRDTGIGIPEAALGLIFSEFTQADSSTARRYGGTGLGLSIVKRLVAMMEGNITVQSRVGSGSSFDVTIPLNALPQISENHDANSHIDLEGIRVLVVDDNEANRTIVREMLTSIGASVDECDSGEAGLKAIDQASASDQQYRLLLVDHRMPNMDGFQMIEKLRSMHDHRELLVVMLSSDDLAVSIARVRELNLARYLVKPVKRGDLYAAIEEVLSGLPRPATASDMAQPVLEPSAAQFGSPPRPMRILLADDSAGNRLLVRSYLQKFPYGIEEAHDGVQAVSKFKSGSYDLVLMDIQMPSLDGYDATREIRLWEHSQNLSSTPIVALTASVLEQDVLRAMEAGCDFHLSKPVKKATLLELIENVASAKPVQADL